LPGKENDEVLSNLFGHFLDRPLSTVAKRIKISPNAITLAGMIVMTVAAIALPFNLKLGGFLILCAGLFDLLDGIIARVNSKTSDFGAFLDSVLDRYSDSFLLIGFLCFFLLNNSVTGVLLSLGTMVGTFLVSYTKARAEGLGTDCQTGLMERPERIIIMTLGALTGYVIEMMWVLLILTHFTALQRIHHVWKQMK
jgi:phosphatidylglycerophosphate synthase